MTKAIMDFMTRDVFDLLIVVIIIIGGALALVRLYRDLTRPLPPLRDDDLPPVDDDDTQPHQPIINSENIDHRS